jgi:hypothetical protein
VFVPLVALSVTVSPVVPPVALKVGVLSLVLLSVLLVPVSELLARSGAPGAVGALVSIETDNAVDAADAPAVGSDSVAVMDHVPSTKVPKLQPVAGST